MRHAAAPDATAVGAGTLLVAALAAGLILAAASPGAAQETLRREIRDSQLRLEEIRQERQRLEREMAALQERVSDVSARLENIERQIAASADLLRELEFQSAALARGVEETTAELVRTRDRLTERRVVLNTRLRSIYKRGPLHTIRVLLSAESFADLLNRYKYLHLIALYDRWLIEEIGRLERTLASRERELTRNLADMQRIRAERLEEFARLRSLEREQELALQSFRTQARRTEDRLQQLARDEQRLANLVAELERRRLEEERRRAVAGRAPSPEGTLSTRDLGALEWPLEGRLAYRFGPERRPNGVVLRRNGIGIAARPGTPVLAVEAGTVVMAGPFEGYGPSVLISHGGGYYTLYLYLGEVRVREGQVVAARPVLGTVGGDGAPAGPQIEFQVRAPGAGNVPEPVDPLDWLRARSGT